MKKYVCIRTEPYTTEDRQRQETVAMGTEFTDATFLFTEAILRTRDRRTAIRVPLNVMADRFRERR